MAGILYSSSNESAALRSKGGAAKHFLPIFENKSIISISQMDIENYRLQHKLETVELPKNVGKREKDISFRAVNLELTTLSYFFNYCIKKGYIDKNLCTCIKKLNELSRVKTLSDEDIQKLIKLSPVSRLFFSIQ